MSFQEFQIIILICSGFCWLLALELRASGRPLSETSRRVVGFACAIALLTISCLHLVNDVPVFAYIAMNYLSIQPDNTEDGILFVGTNLGFAALMGVMGICALMLVFGRGKSG